MNEARKITENERQVLIGIKQRYGGAYVKHYTNHYYQMLDQLELLGYNMEDRDTYLEEYNVMWTRWYVFHQEMNYKQQQLRDEELNFNNLTRYIN